MDMGGGWKLVHTQQMHRSLVELRASLEMVTYIHKYSPLLLHNIEKVNAELNNRCLLFTDEFFK